MRIDLAQSSPLPGALRESVLTRGVPLAADAGQVAAGAPTSFMNRLAGAVRSVSEVQPNTDLPAALPVPPEGPGAVAGAQAPFMDRLASAVQSVNQLQQDADSQAMRLATGDANNVQDVVIAMEKADLALQLTVQVTQKAVDAYREISRMQI